MTDIEGVIYKKKAIHLGNGRFKKSSILKKDKVGKEAENELKLMQTKITATSGNIYNADEDSQNRINRAITIMEKYGYLEIEWVLANGETALVTLDELYEVLMKAGMDQLSLWKGI